MYILKNPVCIAYADFGAVPWALASTNGIATGPGAGRNPSSEVNQHGSAPQVGSKTSPGRFRFAAKLHRAFVVFAGRPRVPTWIV
jgi:hypothetical protein